MTRVFYSWLIFRPAFLPFGLLLGVASLLPLS